MYVPYYTVSRYRPTSDNDDNDGSYDDVALARSPLI